MSTDQTSATRTAARAVLTGIRHHPMRTLAICVPLAAVSVLAGAQVASAGPQAFLAVSPAQATAAPAPLVMNFDGGMPGAVNKTNKADHPTAERWNLDGCDHDYGTANVCVPWKIPAATPEAACAWLKANGFVLPLKVYGTDRQHLPENAAGYVCAGAS
jgi:hypothetical protein